MEQKKQNYRASELQNFRKRGLLGHTFLKPALCASLMHPCVHAVMHQKKRSIFIMSTITEKQVYHVNF